MRLTYQVRNTILLDSGMIDDSIFQLTRVLNSDMIRLARNDRKGVKSLTGLRKKSQKRP